MLPDDHRPIHKSSSLYRMKGIETWYHFEFSDSNTDSELTKNQAHSHSKPVSVASITDSISKDQAMLRKSSFSGQFFLEDGSAITFETGGTQLWTGSLKISTSETDDLDELITAVQNSDAQALRVLSLLPSGTKLFKGVPQSAATDNGCHENYEAIVAEGKLLRVYRILIRTALCTQLLAKTVTAVCVSLLFGCQCLVSRRKPCSLSEATFEDFQSVPGILKSPVLLTVRYSHAPTVFLIRYIGKWVAFRKQRRYLTAFLLSRQAVFGTGYLAKDGRYSLSFSGAMADSINGIGSHFGDSPLFCYSHWVNQFCKDSHLRVKNYRDLLRPMQRLQIGLSDANNSELLNRIKIGVTSTLLDMIEAGETQSLPVLRSPHKALQQASWDWHLVRQFQTDHGKQTLQEIQVHYWKAANEYATSLEGIRREELSRLLKDWWVLIEGVNSLENNASNVDTNPTGIEWISRRSELDTVKPPNNLQAKQQTSCSFDQMQQEHTAIKPSGMAAYHLKDSSSREDPSQQAAGSIRSKRKRFIRENQATQNCIEITWNNALIDDSSQERLVSFRTENT